MTSKIGVSQKMKGIKSAAALYSLFSTIKLDYCESGEYKDVRTVWLIQ